jgi:hypothetical protein
MKPQNLKAIRLYEQANRAAADAARLDRIPGAEGIAALRRQDARALRAWAREAMPVG